MTTTSTLTGPALQASRAALSAAMADQSISSCGRDDLEPGEIQEIDMETQADSIRTVFSDPTNFNVKHPLYSPWTLWFDSPASKNRNLPQTPSTAFPQTPIPQTPSVAAAQGWMEDIKRVISFDSVEEFWGLYNNIVPPSQLPPKANYYLFKEGIIPAWEDEANKDGGKWSIQLPKDKNRGNVDMMWLYTMLAAIGETFDPAPADGNCTPSLITGVILSTRPQFYRLSIWTRLAPTGGDNESQLRERIEGVGKHFKMSVLGYHEGAKLQGPLATEVEFLAHKDSSEKKDKAQSAINASPLAGHIPGYQSPNSPDPATHPSPNLAAAQGASKSHTLESLQHQFRSIQQQYSTTSPVQRIITTGKGVAIDFDSVSRDSKAQSKEVYTWGQSEPEDLKDVTDRLAYLNFVQGSLASSLSKKLDGARTPFKALRDLETSITPRRNVRAGLQLQINRIEHEQQKGNEKRLADLRDQLKKAESDDQQAERDVEVMKRKAVRESEQLKWEALREYGEKLVLLSQAATPIIAVLPAIPPSPSLPYTGGKSTGAIRASLQRALDNYKTGHINLPSPVNDSDDTRSFGESHASELSSIDSEASSLSAAHDTPLSSAKPLPSSDSPPPRSLVPIDVTTLNYSPAPIPTAIAAVETVPDPASPGQILPAMMPTIAETGIPVTSGQSSPGPSSGSLLDIKHGSAPSGTPGVKYESAGEQKKRLAAAYSQQVSTEAVVSAVQGPSQTTATVPTPQSESAEEEKKRLEREEREKILHNPTSKGNDEDLPAYEEPGL